MPNDIRLVPGREKNEILSPGREFDALIATKVMGWKEGGLVSTTGGLDPRTWETGIELPPIQIPPGMTVEAYYQNNPMPRFKRPILLRSEFCPSTDIAAAWEVVRAMRSQGWMWEASTSAEGKTYFNFLRWEDNDQVMLGACRLLKHGAEGDEEQLAATICLAALKAVAFQEK